jgi:hypothetical protein
MRVQILQDSFGTNTGVFIPMNDWNIISQKHQDLKELIEVKKTKPKMKMFVLIGSLSNETREALLSEVADSRKGWERRLAKQF